MERLVDVLTVNDLLEDEIDSFLAAVWAAARIHGQQLRERGIQPDARTACLLENALTMIDGDCELLYAVMLLRKLGTELQLFAQPQLEKNRQTSSFHVSRVARYRTQPGELPDIRANVKSFVQDICKDTEFDVLCWGADLPESTVQAVLNGTDTKLRDMSKVLRAAGFHLRLVLVHEEQQLVIGDQQFQAKFFNLYKRSFRELLLARLKRAAFREEDDCAGFNADPNSWQLLLGDLQ